MPDPKDTPRPRTAHEDDTFRPPERVRHLSVLAACGCGSGCSCGCQSGGPCQCGGGCG